MEDFAMGFALVLWLCFTYWLVTELQQLNKINAGLKIKVETLTAERHAIAADKHALMRENSALEALIDAGRATALTPFSEIFTDHEFKTREQQREEAKALGRRHTDRYQGPKPTLGWEDQDDHAMRI